MTEVSLRNQRIPAINLVDMASASLSKNYLTISRLYKYEDKEDFDWMLLDLKEAKELFNFLKENL